MPQPIRRPSRLKCPKNQTGAADHSFRLCASSSWSAFRFSQRSDRYRTVSGLIISFAGSTMVSLNAVDPDCGSGFLMGSVNSAGVCHAIGGCPRADTNSPDQWVGSIHPTIAIQWLRRPGNPVTRQQAADETGPPAPADVQPARCGTATGPLFLHILLQVDDHDRRLSLKVRRKGCPDRPEQPTRKMTDAHCRSRDRQAAADNPFPIHLQAGCRLRPHRTLPALPARRPPSLSTTSSGLTSLRRPPHGA